jgi:type IV pilus assembly protein PilO
VIKFGPQELLFLVVLIAMPAASWWLVFKPQNHEIAEAKREIEHKRMMLEKLDEATAQTDDLAAANDEIATSIDLVESRLPGDKEVEVVLEQVAELARRSKLDLARVKSGEPVSAASYMEQPLEMEILGDFDDFYTFLLDVEKLDRITRMLDLTLERDDKQDGRMSAEFVLSIYFEPASASSVAEVEP